MKIQELAIIFIIIILPISIVLATFTQYQIQTINTQTLYDNKLSAATYDAIRAFQINTSENKLSELQNSKIRDIEGSVSTFRNSIKSAFSLDGYSDEELNSYMPALVYTLYDGFYIYSPYKNENYRYDENGNKKDDNGENLYGLKPYISYSCRYTKGNIDVVITYALDNHITVQGMINGEFVDKDGYLIDNISYDEDSDIVIYNGIEIAKEHTKEYLPLQGGKEYSYMKLDGKTYYLDETNKKIRARLNENTLTDQYKEGDMDYEKAVRLIKQGNTLAKDYYIDAYNFTKWFKSTELKNLTYADAQDTIVTKDGEVKSQENVWYNNNTKIFQFNDSNIDYSKNIENELSSFNQHRLTVIRHKIEVNLAIAIANYNNYSGVASSNVFQMPDLKEDEWYNIIHNISLISFLQGLPIGGKTYNGYSIVTNSESEEVVLEQNIYILGKNTTTGKYEYYKIGDQGIKDGTVEIDSGDYAESSNKYISAGRLNLSFKRDLLTNGEQRYYYYPIQKYNASYNSIIMQNNVDTYDDVYTYINNQGIELKTAFYTALGRERASTYKSWDDYISNREYVITLEPNGGTVSPTEIKVKYLSEYGILPTPQKDGHIFAGWYTSPNGGERINENSINRNKYDSTLYAHWTKIEYTVTLDPNGGTVSSNIKKIGYGEKYGALPIPEKNGYVFNGWYTSLDGGEQINENSINRNKNDSTLYAHWTRTEYTLTFDPNGGTVSPTSKKVRYGEKYGTLPTPNKNGYEFNGWFNSSGVQINENTVKRTANNETLKAGWKEEYKLGRIGIPQKNTTLMIGANPQGNSPQFAYGNINMYTLRVENDNGCIIKLDAKNNTGNGNMNQQTTLWKNLAGNNNDGQINGATWKNDCLSFNGTNNYVNLGQVNFEYKVVYDTEISVNSTQSGEAEIISNFETGGAGLYLDSGRVVFCVWSEKYNDYIRLRSSSIVPTNKKIKIQGYYDGNRMYLKIDGQIVAQKQN